MPRRKKPAVAVWKFASCDGCQLSLLDCEDQLLPLAGLVDFARFGLASRAVVKGPYDISLVEGSITTPRDAEHVHQIRRASKKVVAIGACATAGGIQALKNFRPAREFLPVVYPSPEYIETLNRSTPIADHVFVDYELHGCPISRVQLLDVLGAFIQGRKPVLPTYSVCIDCKRLGNVCVAVATGTPCLGPVALTGCGALCPGWSRGCYGCLGPKAAPNASALSAFWKQQGMRRPDIVRAFRTFNASAEAFRRESEAHET